MIARVGPGLTRLDARDTWHTSDDEWPRYAAIVDALSERAPRLVRLSLTLANPWFRPRGDPAFVRSLADALPRWTVLRTLSLRGCGLTAGTLVALLPACGGVVALDLSRNHFDDRPEDAEPAVLQFLRRLDSGLLPTLAHLRLDECLIDRDRRELLLGRTPKIAEARGLPLRTVRADRNPMRIDRRGTVFVVGATTLRRLALRAVAALLRSRPVVRPDAPIRLFLARAHSRTLAISRTPARRRYHR